MLSIYVSGPQYGHISFGYKTFIVDYIVQKPSVVGTILKDDFNNYIIVKEILDRDGDWTLFIASDYDMNEHREKIIKEILK